MKKPTKHMSAMLIASAALLNSQTVLAQTGFEQEYKITVTNITPNSLFTPVAAIAHVPGVKLYTLGKPAIPALVAVAEAGDTHRLMNLMEDLPNIIKDYAVSDGVVPPGGSVTLWLSANEASHVSVVSMLIPSNDTFFALNGKKIPPEGHLVHFSPALDAGSETNDESCDHVPGPPSVCNPGGQGLSPDDHGEGFVHVSRGISGDGDIPVAYDWRNPVAKIEVMRVPMDGGMCRLPQPRGGDAAFSGGAEPN